MENKKYCSYRVAKAMFQNGIGAGNEAFYTKDKELHTCKITVPVDTLPCCTLDEAIFLVREVRKWHIMPIPKKIDVWSVWIISLHAPNKIDGKLNFCELSKKCKTYEEAAEYGLWQMLKILNNANKEILKHINDPAFFEDIRQECEERGFDCK